jgi:hypothetical protein
MDEMIKNVCRTYDVISDTRRRLDPSHTRIFQFSFLFLFLFLAELSPLLGLQMQILVRGLRFNRVQCVSSRRVLTVAWILWDALLGCWLKRIETFVGAATTLQYRAVTILVRNPSRCLDISRPRCAYGSIVRLTRESPYAWLFRSW